MAATAYKVLLGGDPAGSLLSALRGLGLVVTVVEDAAPAQVDRAAAEADVIVMADDGLGVDCLAMLERIRQRHPDLPIILLGRRCQVDLALQALKLGRVEYLTRPISLPRLCDRIEDAVDRRNCLQELLSLRAREAGERQDEGR